MKRSGNILLLANYKRYRNGVCTELKKENYSIFGNFLKFFPSLVFLACAETCCGRIYFIAPVLVKVIERALAQNEEEERRCVLIIFEIRFYKSFAEKHRPKFPHDYFRTNDRL